MNGNRRKNTDSAVRIFLRSMILTISAVSLILIGYFTAHYFFGGV